MRQKLCCGVACNHCFSVSEGLTLHTHAFQCTRHMSACLKPHIINILAIPINLSKNRAIRNRCEFMCACVIKYNTGLWGVAGKWIQTLIQLCSVLAKPKACAKGSQGSLGFYNSTALPSEERCGNIVKSHFSKLTNSDLTPPQFELCIKPWSSNPVLAVQALPENIGW